MCLKITHVMFKCEHLIHWKYSNKIIKKIFSVWWICFSQHIHIFSSIAPLSKVSLSTLSEDWTTFLKHKYWGYEKSIVVQLICQVDTKSVKPENYSILFIKYLLHIALKYSTAAIKHIFGTVSSVLCQDYSIWYCLTK